MSTKNNRGNDKQYNRNTKCKGRSGKNQGRFEESKSSDLKGKTAARNDSGWYQADSVLMRDAASLPFPNATGMPLQISDALGHIRLLNGDQTTVPGIMRVNVITTPGTMGSWNDPINVAIRDIYSFVRHQNSGSKNYDAADLGVYFYAYDSCATYYAYLVRLYGVIRTVLLRNRYTPEDLVTVMGADYQNLVANYAQLRAYINTFAARLSAMRVPSSLHFIERHMWLFSHVFADSQTDKCQMYVVNPGAFWEYKVGTTAQDTYFWLSEKVPMAGALYDFERLTVFGDALLNSVLNSEDFNIMSGDILKAYGDKTFNLNMISEDFSVPVTYEPEFLLQLHNATVFECESKSNDEDRLYKDWKIFQDYSNTPNVGALQCDFSMSLDAASNTVKAKARLASTALARPLDVPVDQPDAELIAIATRMMAFAQYYGVDQKHTIEPYAFGTELVVGCWFYNKSRTTKLLDRTPKSALLDYADKWTFGVLPIYVDAGDFDVSAGSFSTAPNIVGSIDNITMVPAAVLYNIHRAALLGMYGLAK